MKHTETQIHIAIVHWIKTVSPSTVFWHTPNGGLRSKREAAKLRAMGTLPGVPDLILICEPPGPCLAFLEIKAPGAYLSFEQRSFRHAVEGMGAPYWVVRSIDEVRSAFKKMNVRSREAMAGVAA